MDSEQLVAYMKAPKENLRERCSTTSTEPQLLGGGKPPQQQRRDPFRTPVRGMPGSKGERPSRMSGRKGGMALIRKYGILMKRQEFREKAEEIGFVKYR